MITSPCQIVAIAKVNGASAIYTDDGTLIAFVSMQDIPCIRVAEMAIPDEARQMNLLEENPK